MWGIDRYWYCRATQVNLKITEYSIFSDKITIDRKIKHKYFRHKKSIFPNHKNDI